MARHKVPVHQLRPAKIFLFVRPLIELAPNGRSLCRPGQAAPFRRSSKIQPLPARQKAFGGHDAKLSVRELLCTSNKILAIRQPADSKETLHAIRECMQQRFFDVRQTTIRQPTILVLPGRKAISSPLAKRSFNIPILAERHPCFAQAPCRHYVVERPSGIREL